MKILSKLNLKKNNSQKIKFLSIFLVVLLGVFFLVKPVDAAIFDIDLVEFFQKGVLLMIGGFLQVIISTVGLLATIIVKVILSIATYNNFINEDSIVTAWGIIRDICNMFFIIILLVIAFATILRIESYNMKRWLPKLLIMAVLINFSRTIAGLIIDASQVFMVTFLAGIGDTGGSVFNALGVQDYFNLVRNENINLASPDDVDFISTLIGLIIGTIFLMIATVVLLVVLGVLIIRMVMLWIYIVLSPLAFLMAAFPAGQKYSSMWWDDFIKQVITGPILIFFLWLGLYAASNFDTNQFNQGACFGPYQTLCPSNFLHFVVAIGMLFGGLIVTSKAGGAAGAVAGKGMSAINKGKAFALRKTKSGTVKTGKFAGRKTAGVARGLDRNLARLPGGRNLAGEGGLIEGTARRVGSNITLAKPVGNYFKKKRQEREEKYKLLRDKQDIDNNQNLSNDERMKAYEGLKRTIGGVEYQYDKNKDMLVGSDNSGREKNIKPSSEFMARMYEGSASVNSSAWAAAKAAEDKKIAEEADKAKNSGVPEQALRRRALDKSLPEAERKEAALALGQKADHLGSLSHEDVDEVRSVLGDNEMLKKKFDDSMVKKYAHKLYNTKTEVGKKQLEKAIKKGKVDEIMDKSFYKDKKAMEIFKDATGSNFVRKIKKAAEHDDDIKDAIVGGLEENINEIPEAIEDGVIHPMREAMATVTKDFSRAFKGVTDEDQMKEGIESLYGKMGNNDRAQLKVGGITRGSSEVSKNIADGMEDKYIDHLHGFLADKLTRKNIESMKDRAENKDPRTIEKYEEIVDRREAGQGLVNQHSRPIRE